MTRRRRDQYKLPPNWYAEAKAACKIPSPAPVAGQTQAGAGPEPELVQVTLRIMPHSEPWEQRLKRLLKWAGRSLGLKCEDLTYILPNKRSHAEESTDAHEPR